MELFEQGGRADAGLGVQTIERLFDDQRRENTASGRDQRSGRHPDPYPG